MVLHEIYSRNSEANVPRESCTDYNNNNLFIVQISNTVQYTAWTMNVIVTIHRIIFKLIQSH